MAEDTFSFVTRAACKECREHCPKPSWALLITIFLTIFAGLSAVGGIALNAQSSTTALKARMDKTSERLLKAEKDLLRLEYQKGVIPSEDIGKTEQAGQ